MLRRRLLSETGQKEARSMRNMAKLAALVVLGVLLAGILLPAVVRAEAVQVPVPDIQITPPGSGVDSNRVLAVFNEFTKYALILSGGVLTLVLIVIGYKFATTSDAKSRADVMDWLKWVVFGAGLTFGGAFITRVLVNIFTRAFS